MKVWVVAHTDWDTEGNVAPTTIVGVYSSESLIPEGFSNSHLYETYNIHEVEVDKVESWDN